MKTKKTNYKIIIVILFCFVLMLSFGSYFIFYTNYKPIVKQETSKYNLDYKLVLAVIKTESNFDKNSVSPKGAVGLMQIMPDTAKWICETQLYIDYNLSLLYEPQFNISLGVWYLDYLLNKFDKPFALAAYNAGEGVVEKWINDGIDKVDDIPYTETKNYVTRVILYQKLYFIK